MTRIATLFNGLEIVLKDGGQLFTTKHDKIKGLAVTTTGPGFRNQRTLVQYVGVNCGPDFCAAVQLITKGNEITTESQFASLKGAIQHPQKPHTQGLDSMKPDMNCMCVVVLFNVSFANAVGFKNQPGYVMLMVSKEPNANNVQQGRCRCHRVTRSAMAAEVYAMMHSVHVGMIVRDALNESLNQGIEMEAFVDS